MIYAKHPTLGNAQFPDDKRAELEAQGWVIWPRAPEQKAGQVAAPREEPQAPPPPASAVAASVVTRAEALAYAEQRGVRVDGRWSDSRLMKELGL
jgi:hypothetical protein